jgi:hypothetical protein
LLFPDHQTRQLLAREHQATQQLTRAQTSRVRLAAAGAIAVLCAITAMSGAAVAGNATPSLPRQNPSTAATILPGDSPVPFWPHETGARVGTSETYLNVREDGSYFDLGIGRRVFVAG